jgi:hypothetical protein
VSNPKQIAFDFGPMKVIEVYEVARNPTGMKGFANGGPLAELSRGTSRFSVDEYLVMRDRIMANRKIMLC